MRKRGTAPVAAVVRNTGRPADLKQRGVQLGKPMLHGETEADWRELREAARDGLLQELAAAAAIDLARLGPRKSETGKVLLAAVLRDDVAVYVQ